MPTSLESYISEAKRKNASEDQIRMTLVNAGWAEKEVNQALSSHEEIIPLPPPPVPHIGMWTGFLYILFFIFLYGLSTSIGIILHIWVEKVIKDPNNSLQSGAFEWFSSPDLLRSTLSALIVSYIIFALLAFVLKKQITKQPLVKNLRSRKLLIYITLIGTVLIMVCHIISDFTMFLNGTLTQNALAHLIVTLLIAGAIFLYFLQEVKYDRK